jgi:hypothetical protein
LRRHKPIKPKIPTERHFSVLEDSSSTLKVRYAKASTNRIAKIVLNLITPKINLNSELNGNPRISRNDEETLLKKRL